MRGRLLRQAAAFLAMTFSKVQSTIDQTPAYFMPGQFWLSLVMTAAGMKVMAGISLPAVTLS